MHDQRNKAQKEASPQQPPIINNFNYYGPVEKVIHETRHDSSGNTTLNEEPDKK
jgi:hypothetical protein